LAESYGALKAPTTVYKLVSLRFLGSSPHWRCVNTTGSHTLQLESCVWEW